MTDKIIIDKVDVSGCEFFMLFGSNEIEDFENACTLNDRCINCSKKQNCYYKQLQREKQNSQEARDTSIKEFNRAERYKQALEKIENEINNTPKHYWGQRHVEFLEIINKALEDENRKE